MNSTPVPPEIFGFGLGMFLLLGLIALFSLGLFAFWLWMLIDCAQAPEPPGSSNHRLIWILVLVFTGWIGALIYFFVARQPRAAFAHRHAPPRLSAIRRG